MNKQFSLKIPADKLFEGVYITDENKKILLFNSAAEELTGFSAGKMVGEECELYLRHIDSAGRILCRTDGCPLQAALNGTDYSGTLYLSHMEGYRIPVEVRCLRAEKNKKPLLFQYFRVEQESRQLEKIIKKLQREISRDPLTRLYNRRHTERVIRSRIEELRRYSASAGILFIDIDDFKKINDSLGHDAGDRLLKNIAKTLTHNSRLADTVGRWGGEEFIVILPGADPVSLRAAGEKYRTLIKNTQYVSGKNISEVSASIGGTLFKKTDTVKSLIKRADSLMYQSKADGKDRVTL